MGCTSAPSIHRELQNGIQDTGRHMQACCFLCPLIWRELKISKATIWEKSVCAPDAHFPLLLLHPFSFLLKIRKSRSREVILPLKGMENWWGYHCAFWISSCILCLKKPCLQKRKKTNTLKHCLQDTACTELTLPGGCAQLCSLQWGWGAVCSEKGTLQKRGGRRSPPGVPAEISAAGLQLSCYNPVGYRSAGELCQQWAA